MPLCRVTSTTAELASGLGCVFGGTLFVGVLVYGIVRAIGWVIGGFVASYRHLTLSCSVGAELADEQGANNEAVAHGALKTSIGMVPASLRSKLEGKGPPVSEQPCYLVASMVSVR